MSAKKVRRHIRRLQRERRRSERQVRREEQQQLREERRCDRAEARQERAEVRQQRAAQAAAASEEPAGESGQEPVQDPVQEPVREPAGESAVSREEHAAHASEDTLDEAAVFDEPASEPEPEPEPEPAADTAVGGTEAAETSEVPETEVAGAEAVEPEAAGIEPAEADAAGSDTSETDTPEADTPDTETADPGAPRTPLIAGGLRTGAVVLAVGVLAVAGGSLAVDITGPSDQPRPVAAAEVPAVVADAALVCPAMPGVPESVSTDGPLDYRDRDDSARTLTRGLVLAPSPEAPYEAAELGALTEDGYEAGEEVSLEAAEPGITVDPEAEITAWPHATLTAEDESSPLLRLLSQDPAEKQHSGVGAGQYLYTADSGPVTGLAAADCLTPQRSHWFFGPEIGEGASSLLTLANPSDRQATVEVTAYDSDGARSGTGVRTLAVPAQSVRTVNIAAVTGDDPVGGVEIRASQAPVTASLQSARASEGTGLGVEFLPALRSPAQQHVIPGVPVAADSEEESAAFPTELWIRSAAEGQSTVEVQVYGEDGPAALEGASTFSVEGGEVDSVDLSGMEPGTYDVVVTTEAPSEVAVKTYGAEPEDQDRLDFAWAVDAAPLAAGSGALLPGDDDVEAQVRLFAPEEGGTVSYRLLDADGGTSDRRTAEVPIGGAVTLSGDDLRDDGVEDPIAIVFDASDPEIHGSLLLTGEDGTLSMLAVRPLDDAAPSVPVRLAE